MKYFWTFLAICLTPLAALANPPIPTAFANPDTQYHRPPSPPSHVHKRPLPPPVYYPPAHYGYNNPNGYGGITIRNGKISGGLMIDLGVNRGYNTAYTQGYYDGYYNNRNNDKVIINNNGNSSDAAGEDRYECTIKLRGNKYTARGHFRDTAQSRAIESCRDDYDASQCRSANMSCESIW